MRGVALGLLLAATGCNSLLGIEDLTLIDAPPTDAQSLFIVREGSAGYAMTQDTYITDAMATTALGDAVDLQWTTTNNTHALLRFDDLFGSGGIPAGTIRSATLDVFVLEAGSGGGRLYESAVDWSEATTYNTFGPAAGVTADDRGTQVGTIAASVTGLVSINVTTSLGRWATTPASNRGWIIVPADSSLVRIASSDDPDESHRPTLTIDVLRSD